MEMPANFKQPSQAFAKASLSVFRTTIQGKSLPGFMLYAYLFTI
jgi:hypothetical protein